MSFLNRPLWQRFVLCLALLLSAVGCTPSPALPTLMVLPTYEPTQTSSAAPVVQISTLTPTVATLTQTPSPTPTLSPTATPTSTAAATRTRTATATATPSPEADAVVANADGVNLRSGPNTAFEPPLALLPDGTRLRLIALSPNLLWYKVVAETGQQGWAYSKLLEIYQEPPGMPIVDVPLPTAPSVIYIPPPSVGIPAVGSSANVSLASAGGGSSVSSRMMQVYQQGLAMGNNPRMFAKVGDSITSNQSFLIGYGSAQYNLGGFGSLQESISYFSADAFTRASVAAKPGFSTASVIDPLMAPQGVCQPNESPLMCEYRLTRPSIAIILLGAVDVQRYDVNAFQDYLNQVVNMTTSQGIVPVLTTFTYASDYYPEQSEAFNGVIRAIAAGQQLPLIDFQMAAVNMPGRGVGSDKFHLTQRTDDWINLTGDENQYGSTMRNLITLQALDNIRRGLGMN